ncbi:hypothetical protein GUJ93_ZPchr0014g47111 [Zizania palustris]|uniref:Uncharacterized protein n=1 Tax=Zizania palustris TaxID=103762 RepID=A0A8J5SX05_ZIZPA|nr:hypothetical protein GUJ93_ZPchr0014g47111 [Zizania palustris]
MLLSPPPWTPLSRLLFSDSLALMGDTSLVASRDGENEHRRPLLLDAAACAFAGDDTNLAAKRDGENVQHRVFVPDAAAAAFDFPGGDTATGLEASSLPWLLSLHPSELGGDLSRNLCGVCLVMTGDRVL